MTDVACSREPVIDGTSLVAPSGADGRGLPRTLPAMSAAEAGDACGRTDSGAGPERPTPKAEERIR